MFALRKVIGVPYTFEWLVEDAVIYEQVAGEMSADEMSDGAADLVAMLEGSERPLVHIIFDTTEMTSIPKKLGAVVEVARPLFSHERLGWVIVFGLDNKFLSYLATTTISLFKVRFRPMDNYNDATEFLQSVDSTLPELAQIERP